MSEKILKLRGARTHNLRRVNLDIPLESITLVCGPSGCGKTSLLLDTLHAESQRLYLQSIGFGQGAEMQLPPVELDSVEGLPPTLALGPNTLPINSRSTVASLSECAAPLRTLFARFGLAYCPHCHSPLPALEPQAMTAQIASLAQGSRLQILAPITVEKGKTLAEVASYWLSRGFLRARVEGADCSLESPENPQHSIEQIQLVVDRILLKDSMRTRIAEAVEKALDLGGGKLLVLEGSKEYLLASAPTCPQHGPVVAQLTPAHFNHEQKAGECTLCRGCGIADDKSCPSCQGFRLHPIQQQVQVFQKTWRQWVEQPLTELAPWLEAQISQSSGALQEILVLLNRRIQPLLKLELGHLSLYRSANTLSQGEQQRLRLCSFACGQQSGLLFILDEPGASLHPKDCPSVLSLLREIQQRGNTIVLAEHRTPFIKFADYLVEMGPGAGSRGGNIMVAAKREIALEDSASRCGLILRENPYTAHRTPRIPQSLWTLQNISHLHLQIPQLNLPLGNLVVLKGVSGSGKSCLLHQVLAKILQSYLDGKVPDAGLGILHAPKNNEKSLEALCATQVTSQRPAPRSLVITAIDGFTALRELFALLPLSKARGWSPSRFTLQSKGGRCEYCKGSGIQENLGLWVPQQEVPCPICQGKRFREDTLEVHWKGLDIAQILHLSVEQAGNIFADHPLLGSRLQIMTELGLGYLQLGQPLRRCSSGERQRLHLATDISRSRLPRTIYLLDEPSRGLFFDDVEMLVQLFDKLCAQGHTLVVADNHPQLINAADWIWELGPGAGPLGGRLLKDGPP